MGTQKSHRGISQPNHFPLWNENEIPKKIGFDWFLWIRWIRITNTTKLSLFLEQNAKNFGQRRWLHYSLWNEALIKDLQNEKNLFTGREGGDITEKSHTCIIGRRIVYRRTFPLSKATKTEGKINSIGRKAKFQISPGHYLPIVIITNSALWKPSKT